jgi:large subunit ribosomal protein L30
MAASLRVTLVRSVVSTSPGLRATVRALGLRRIGQTVELPDNPAVRGQVRAVRSLVSVGQGTDQAPTTGEGSGA